MKPCSINPGEVITVTPHLSKMPTHQGTFHHIDKGGMIVYLQHGRTQLYKCSWKEVDSISPRILNSADPADNPTLFNCCFS